MSFETVVPVLVPTLRFFQRAAPTLSTLAAALALAGCASIQTSNVSDSPTTMKLHEVAVTRTALIAAAPEKVFAFITAQDVLPKVLTGYGPLPAVVRTSEVTGAWEIPGSARLIHLADGSTVREQLTHHQPSQHFAYRVWEFGNPILGVLATQARGEWLFSPTANGTQVTWTYTFTAKNAAAALPLSGIAQLLWRGYMDVCLKNTQRLMSPSAATN